MKVIVSACPYNFINIVLFLTVSTHTVGIYSPGKDFCTYVIKRLVFPTPL